MAGEGQTIRFKVGEAFPADDRLARWMAVCAMALNDLLTVNSLLIPRLREEIPSGPGESFYLARLAGAHLFEAASFLSRSDRITEIASFVSGLGEEPVGPTANSSRWARAGAAPCKSS